MFCRQAHILMMKQLREVLPPEQDAALARHLETCRPCAEERSAMQSLTERLTPSPLASPLPALSPERRQAIWQESRLAAAPASRNGFRNTPWVLAAAATVLAVALGLRFAVAPHPGSVTGSVPQIVKDTRDDGSSQRHAIVKQPVPPQMGSGTNPNPKGARNTPQVVYREAPHNPALPLQQNQKPQNVNRIAEVEDKTYLDGTNAPLTGYWMGTSTQLRALTHQPEIAFRDDFVSPATSRLASAGSKADVEAAKAEIKRQAQVVDSRLFRLVTLAEKDASLENICGKLKKLTGVHLAAGQGVQDEKATVFVEKKPARDVLRALARLFGYTWERSGDEGAYFYRFKQPLRAQLAEEELRSRDEHEAFLALDEEVQKIAAQDKKSGEQNPYWWAAKMYNRLSPADRTALVNGERLLFTLNAPNPDRRIPADMRGPLLKAFDFNLLERHGMKTIGKTNNLLPPLPEEKDHGPLTSMPDAMPAIQLDIDRTELGVLKLYATAGAYLTSGKGWLGQPNFPYRLMTPMAAGRSASRKKPNNAAANKALLAEPRFQQTGDLLPLSSCKGHTQGRSGGEFDFYADDDGKIERGEEAAHVAAGDVWEALHKQTGLSIVADSYLKFHPAAGVASTNTTLFNALCRAADAMHVRVRKDGDFLLCRSASYVWDKMKEIPARTLRQWAQDRERLGYLPVEDFLEMALLPDRTLDSFPLGRAMQHCLGFGEWGMIGKGGFRGGFMTPETFRNNVRFFAALPPPMRQAAMQPEGIALTDLPQQALEAMLKLGMIHYQNGQPVFAKGRLHCDYVPANHWYWQPILNYGEMQTAPILPVISGTTQEETLRLAQKVRPDAEKDHIKHGNGLFVLTVRHGDDIVQRFGLQAFFRTQ